MILEKDDIKGESIANAIGAAASTLDKYFEDILEGNEETDFFRGGQWTEDAKVEDVVRYAALAMAASNDDVDGMDAEDCLVLAILKDLGDDNTEDAIIHDFAEKHLPDLVNSIEREE